MSGVRSKGDLRRVKEEVAAYALSVLLAAEQIVALSGGMSLSLTALLLALKAGPARPEELARRLNRERSATVREQLLRARMSPLSEGLVRARRDGRYELTLKGHRFVNKIAGVAYHLSVFQPFER